ncbi:MAG: DNA gyrase modulator [Bacteriovoracaceae bacterium]
MNLDIKQSMEMVLKHALKEGADACDIIVNSGESFSLAVHKNEIEKYQVSGSKILGIRVIKDRKVGISYSESFDENELKSCAVNAISNSRFFQMLMNEVIEKTSDMKIPKSDFNQKDSSTIEDKIKLALYLESEVLKKDKRIESAPYNNLMK